ncbi:hypothetical protein T10_3491 [Trichinella papuae]|uniref:Uncharacterized protein n=1 Tax=Trichinella papuae TaxID=268474 RepID=A0A0V1MR93_9BILA|nr:hypothetical protein T10_3491 [Trichinella papuae]
MAIENDEQPITVVSTSAETSHEGQQLTLEERKRHREQETCAKSSFNLKQRMEVEENIYLRYVSQLGKQFQFLSTETDNVINLRHACKLSAKLAFCCTNTKQLRDVPPLLFPLPSPIFAVLLCSIKR